MEDTPVASASATREAREARARLYGATVSYADKANLASSLAERLERGGGVAGVDDGASATQTAALLVEWSLAVLAWAGLATPPRPPPPRISSTPRRQPRPRIARPNQSQNPPPDRRPRPSPRKISASIQSSIRRWWPLRSFGSAAVSARSSAPRRNIVSRRRRRRYARIRNRRSRGRPFARRRAPSERRRTAHPPSPTRIPSTRFSSSPPRRFEVT